MFVSDRSSSGADLVVAPDDLDARADVLPYICAVQSAENILQLGRFWERRRKAASGGENR